MVRSSAAAALKSLGKRGVTQALLADGQCFTTVQLKRGLRQQDPEVDLDALIRPDLQLLSHQVGSRKPNELLFKKMLDRLAGLQIDPEEVLHIGSRIQTDLVPAKKLGMRTALFAGDAASLQATPELLKAPGTRPDLLLTAPQQIAEVLADS